MLELGSINESSSSESSVFSCGYVESPAARPADFANVSMPNSYRIYISGDTLLIDELKNIPERYAGRQINLMLVHLGGTTIPGPKAPLLMVTMDGAQGIELVKLIKPEVTVPIHYDDYDVFLSPLEDFKKKMEEGGLGDRGVYLNRGDEYRFAVK